MHPLQSTAQYAHRLEQEVSIGGFVKTRIFAVVALMIFVANGVSAFAEVKNEQKAFRVVMQNGKETLEAQKSDAHGKATVTTKPGDIVEYRLTLTNPDKQTYKNVKEVMPIPEGMELVKDSASPKPTDASADGKTFSAYPLKRVVQVNGKSVEEPAPASAYKIVRWDVGALAPGANVEMRLRVRVK
jgi:uncharacterized repeat protein (TIGR01451 family)